MSTSGSSHWGFDDQLRILELAQSGFGQGDLVMMVDNNGSVVAGECARPFEDNKSRMDICGYSWGLQMRGASASTGSRAFEPLIVVRRSDAATASLTSLCNQRAGDLNVLISAFRATGDQTARDAQPMLEIELTGAKLIGQFLTTGGPQSTLSEILAIDYRHIAIRSAPQQRSGARGAVRECAMTTSSG